MIISQVAAAEQKPVSGGEIGSVSSKTSGADPSRKARSHSG